MNNIDNTTKSVDYVCKFCKHEWTLKFPEKVVPKGEQTCPSCKKRGFHIKPYNFFEEMKK